MNLKFYLRQFKNRTNAFFFLLTNLGKEKFKCPICNYSGPFQDLKNSTGFRKHAKCPQCGALERHRIQYVVLQDILHNIKASSLKMLHFAPESFFIELFSQQFGQYETADLYMNGVDHNVDLQNLPFADNSYDFIFASHVLEHIPNDKQAISEIRRILKPNGIAVLPVPLVAEKTIEYPEPNSKEEYHVRAPGFDYFERYKLFFSQIEQFSSDLLPEIYQLYLYQDRTKWPTQNCPLRLPMPGEKHIDIVPVCYV
ncbi:MAG: class I SAM-dependent methyltransferase [Pleurocapsa sp.]